MDKDNDLTLGETLLMFAGCLELYARRDWSIGSREPRISPDGTVLPPSSIEEFAARKICELRNIVDWLSHLLPAVLALPHRDLSDELGALLLRAKPYLEGNLGSAELSVASGRHSTAIDDCCIRAFGAAYASMGKDLEDAVSRLRVHEVRKTLELPAAVEADIGNRRVTKKHVFVSYCRENQPEVARLRTDLLSAGESVWWDQDILPGHDWELAIREAMTDAYAVLACFSEETDARKQSGMFPELRDAIALYRQCAPGTIFLIPVRLSKSEIPRFEIDGTKTLDKIQYIDVFPETNRKSAIERLLQAIQHSPNHP